MSLAIRTRLTFWYTAILLTVLTLFGAWVYLVESRLRLRNLDDDLRQAGDGVAEGLAAELDKGTRLPAAARETWQEFATPGTELAIRDAGGRLLAGDAFAGSDLAPASPEGPLARTVAWGNGAHRLRVEDRRHGPTAYRIALARPLARTAAEDALLARTLLIGIPLALVLAAAGGWWIARRALAPVSLMAEQTRQVTDRNPGFRLRVPRPEDELGVLARAFNQLLDRLEGALGAQRQLMADASHELRTPVSIARTAAQVGLAREGRSEEEYRDTLVVIEAQTSRLGRMVEDLLTAARADAGALVVHGSEIYLDELLELCVRDARVLGRERQVDLSCRNGTETPFHGDERLLRQMLMNLLDNALRHTPPGGRVEARLSADEVGFEIAVTDTGSGIPEEARDHIFDRFVRLDPARARPGGAGLGLPIARSIAEAHGGTLVLERTGPGGSTFVARLPRPDPGRR